MEELDKDIKTSTTYFRYKLLSPAGGVKAGTVKLPYSDILSAITYLERDGSTTIYVKKLGLLFSIFTKLLSTRRLKKFSRTNQSELASNLALMLRAGIPLTAALQEMVAGNDMKHISSDLEDIIQKINDGTSFSQAIKYHRAIFPRIMVQLVQIGEKTGQLDAMLENAAEHLKNIDSIYSNTKQALLYPAFVFAALTAGLLFWFYAVVPKIIALFRDMDVVLPTITVYVVNVSNFIQAYIFHMVFGMAAFLIILGIAQKKSLQFRRAVDWLLLRLPVAKSIVSASNMAFITEYFSLLINAGIDIINALEILKNAINNEIYREKLIQVKEGLTQGESIAACFSKVEIFPPFVIRMINIGEKSGTLSKQLSILAEEYQKKLSIIVATIGKMIEPIVLIVAGIMFAIIIGALFLPIYDLISQIS